jgi:hypothetical protein
MGREIRRVIPNWQHPKNGDKFIPMHDESVQEAWDEWLGNWGRISQLDEAAQRKELLIECSVFNLYTEFCSYYGTSPDPDYYRPCWTAEDATWYQVYETVSEGTPMSPPFETADELVYYLCNHGTFWDSKKWSMLAATNFVKNSQWLPSFAMDNGRPIDLTQVDLLN